MMHRRAFIGSALSLIAAPAIVRASSLMPVRAWKAYQPFIDGLPVIAGDGGFLFPPEFEEVIYRLGSGEIIGISRKLVPLVAINDSLLNEAHP